MSLLYMGKRVDESGPEAEVRYKAKYLTTHGLVFGMTGSGKTGLCVGLLEEASRNNIPVIAIDPKGDLTNLVLSWPEIGDNQFADWVDPSKLEGGQTASELGAKMAGIWRNGLAGDGLGPDDIRQLRESTRFTIYTPGSSSGVPVSMLEKFEPPPKFDQLPDEDRSDLVSGVASAVLALVDVDADPLKSKEHILISNILTHAWDQGQALDIQSLIGRIDTPPFTKLGVFEMDAFFPQKKRTALAMRLNGLIASPSFSAWLTGEPLDVETLFEKKPEGSRTSIFYIAHLDDAERMSFVSLLLDRIVAWMRTQPGSGDLRALVYFDEVFGYLPPYPKNPPSKRPLLTILKQARAFGLGAVLATQNPVDVDYKAITNAGTWMIGKLQTDQDKQRILDGLMGASQGDDGPSRSEVSALISGLETRQFVLSSAHQDALVKFKTRFVMSYLRGPMTRQEIGRLKDASFYNLDKLGGAEAPARPKPRKKGAREVVETSVEAQWDEPEAPENQPARPAPQSSGPQVVEADFGDDDAQHGDSAAPKPIPPRQRPSAPPASSSPSSPGTELIAKPRKREGRRPVRTQPPRVHPEGMPALYLSRGALTVPDIADSLDVDSLAITLGQTTYVPALMVSASYAFKAYEGAANRVGPGSTTFVVRPIPDTDDIHWGAVPETDIDGHHTLTKPEKGADYQRPPAWMFNEGKRAYALKAFREQFAAMRTLRIPAAESLGLYGRPEESLEEFKARVAGEMRRRTDMKVDAIENRSGQEQNILAQKIAELRELLEMDKRELAFHKGRGDEVKMQRVIGSIRLRMEKLRKMVFRRDQLSHAGKRQAADVEFAAMDKLAAIRLLTIPLSIEDVKVDFFGLLWVPT